MAKTTMPQCQGCRISDRTVWASLEGEARESFAARRVPSRFSKGDVIYHEGAPCTGMYNVCTGKVKLVRMGRAGRQTIVRIAGTGRTLAETDLFRGDGRHAVTAQAMEDTVVCFLPRNVVLEYFQEHPGMMMDMVRRLSDALHKAELRVESLATQDARHRLAGFLLELAQEDGEPDGEPDRDAVRIRLRLTREEIAEVIGATLETTIRLMSAFKKEGLIRDADGHVVVADMARLERIQGPRVPAGGA